MRKKNKQATFVLLYLPWCAGLRDKTSNALGINNNRAKAGFNIKGAGIK